VNLKDLEELSTSKREIRPSNEEYTLKNGNKIFILAQGRLVNLASAEGHPSEVMDMSFANQFLSMMWLTKNGQTLENNVYDVTKKQDQEVATLKLETQGITIDKLTPDQEKYRTDYSAGT
jgi:adenosylhomocysteinase